MLFDHMRKRNFKYCIIFHPFTSNISLPNFILPLLILLITLILENVKIDYFVSVEKLKIDALVSGGNHFNFQFFTI